MGFSFIVQREDFDPSLDIYLSVQFPCLMCVESGAGSAAVTYLTGTDLMRATNFMQQHHFHLSSRLL